MPQIGRCQKTSRNHSRSSVIRKFMTLCLGVSLLGRRDCFRFRVLRRLNSLHYFLPEHTSASRLHNVRPLFCKCPRSTTSLIVCRVALAPQDRDYVQSSRYETRTMEAGSTRDWSEYLEALDRKWFVLLHHTVEKARDALVFAYLMTMENYGQPKVKAVAKYGKY